MVASLTTEKLELFSVVKLAALCIFPMSPNSQLSSSIAKKLQKRRKHENKAKKKENVEWNYFQSIGWQIFATFVCHESGRDIFGAQKLMTIAAR